MDINTSDSDLIWSLSDAEISVLFWVCQGLTNEAIAKKRNAQEPTVKTQLGSVYKKLKIDESLTDENKRESLIDRYCQILPQIASNEESLETFRTRKRLWEAEKRHQESEAAERIKETVGKLRERQGGPIGIGTTPPRPRIRLINLIVLGLVGIIVIATALIFVSGNKSNENKASFTPSTLITPSQSTSAVQNLPLVNTATLQATSTKAAIAATETSVPTPTPTNTQVPTETPSPSNTPLPTPTPISNVLFNPDFNNGMGDWESVTGKPNILNGYLQGEDNTSLYVGSSWTDYELTFEAYPANCLRALDIIGVRAKDKSNMIAFIYDRCDYSFATIKDGKRTNIPLQKQFYQMYNWTPFDIIVQGNKIIINIAGNNFVSYVNNDYPKGGIVFIMVNNSSIRNVKVTSLK